MKAMHLVLVLAALLLVHTGCSRLGLGGGAAEETPPADLPPLPAATPTPSPTPQPKKSLPPEVRKRYSAAPGWYVQIASYSDRLEAEIEASAYAYRHQGVKRVQVRLNQNERFCLAVGPFTDKGAAEAALAAMREQDPESALRVVRLGR